MLPAMKALLLETSAAVASVAVADGERLLERRIESQRQQSDRILPLVDELLAEAGFGLSSLDGIVLGRGPGSFTGVRVAAAVAQGLGMAAGLGVIGVSSLAAASQAAWREHGAERCLVCVDARMGEVYWGCFDIRDGVAVNRGGEHLDAPARVARPEAAAWTGVGNGFAVYPEQLAAAVGSAERVFAELLPSAGDLLPLALRDWSAGRFVAASEALPVYLRDASAWSVR